MVTLPKYVSLTSGHAEGIDELTAFDNALKAAGIADLNLIKVSSIVPQGARLVPLRDFPVGSLVPTVYAQAYSDVPGQTVAAAIAMGLSPDGRGVIMESHGVGTREEMEEVARRRVEAAFRERGLELHELHVVSAEHTVQRHGCAVAAAVLWGDELEDVPEHWIAEAWTPDVQFRVRVREQIFSLRSPYQHIRIVDTFQFGRMLWLEGTVQASAADHWVYHEMLVHVPLLLHPNPRRVLIVGGGDGGALATVLMHPVEQVVLVEIDQEVVRAARAYLEDFHHNAFDDPRVHLVYEDAFTYLSREHVPFDVVLLDTTDPVGPAMRLATSTFYGLVVRNLAPVALMAVQSGSPWLQPDVVGRTWRAVKANFPYAALYLASMPTYPGGLWSFTLAAQGMDPEEVSEAVLQERFAPLQGRTRYYTPAVHRAAFTLPPFVAELLSGG